MGPRILLALSLVLAACESSVETPDDQRDDAPAAGPRGARGPRGLPGVCVAPEVYYPTGHDDSDGTTARMSEASCRDGDVLFGGGCSFDTGATATTSRPLDRDGVMVWQCAATPRVGATDMAVDAFAVCMVADSEDE